MKSLNPREHAVYLHLMRSNAEREQLRWRRAAFLPGASRLSDESVRDALADRLTDIPMLAASDYFVDGSLLAILSAAVPA